MIHYDALYSPIHTLKERFTQMWKFCPYILAPHADEKCFSPQNISEVSQQMSEAAFSQTTEVDGD